MLKLKVSAGGLPVGSYVGKFIGCEPISNQYGPGLKWTWEISAGPNAGQKAICHTSASPSLKNSCGRILAGVIGKPLSVDAEFEPGQYTGKLYLVTIGKSKAGGTFVEAVSPAPVQ